MKATPLAAIAAFFLAALCAFAPGAASAQAGRDTVFTVAGVNVDETAATGAAAQQAGLLAAQRRGFERLVRRVTLPEQLSRQGLPDVQPADLERLVLSTDVEDERRSGTRYIGRLTVRFDPAGVRTILRGNNLTVVDARTGPTLVAPQVADGTPAETAAMWRQVWEQGGFGQELAPLTIAPAALVGASDWNGASAFAQSVGASSALYATLRVQGASAAATLVEVAAGGVRRDRGEVAAGIGGSDATSLRAALASLADQASQRIQSDWKGRMANSSGQRARVSASALYADERQWEQIKGGLEAAAATLISEIRIEAVGREGALLSFSFTGDRNQLIAELARRGVSLTDGENGPVLRVVRR